MAEKTTRTLQDFKRWKVPELKGYLRDRGLKISGTKEELTALAYGADQMNVPVKITADEDRKRKRESYEALLVVNDCRLPDPLALSSENSLLGTPWLDEKAGMCKWPPVFQIQIAEFLLTADQSIGLGKRLLSDYKEGKAYSYFDSGWLKEIYYNEISPNSNYCFLKSESTPSQGINNIPHKIWVAIEKKSGTVKSAYCTCFAGLGLTCNHIAAILFKVEHAWTNGWVQDSSCTSMPCSWNKYGKNKTKIEPKTVSDMTIRKPHYKKKGEKSAINPPAKQLFQPQKTKSNDEPNIHSLAHTLYANDPNACGFQYVEIPSERNFLPSDDVNVEFHIEIEASVPVPDPVLDIAKTLGDEQELVKALKNFTSREVEAIERATQGQNSNEAWKLQRTGRITASMSHHVMTKVQSLNRATKNSANCTSLLQSICRPSSSSKSIPACRYGNQMENEARENYKKIAKKIHKNLQVHSCGMFVIFDAAYIGASPDGVVECNCCNKGLLEIKCPFKIAHEAPSVSNLSYIHTKEDGAVELSRSHPYYSQMQHQMGVTKLPWCDFFVYTRHGHYLERVLFDQERWIKLKDAADSFFTNFVATELISLSKDSEFANTDM
eukprot:gene12122-13374_t